MSESLKLNRIATLVASWTAVIGALALLGAVLGVDWLRGGLLGLRPISGNSGLGFLLAGSSLLLLHRGQRAWTRAIGLALAAFLLVVSCVNLLAAFGHPLTFLGKLIGPAHGTFPSSRVPLNTPLPFLIASLGLLALYPPRRTWFSVSNWLGLAVANLALLALVDLLLRPESAVSRMSLLSSTGFLLLGTGLVCARMNREFLRFFSREHPLGFLARRLALVGLSVPLLLYALEVVWLLPLAPQSHNFIALVAVLLNIFILGAFTFSLRRMDDLDRRRRDAESARDILLARLQQQAAGLEIEIADRTRSLNETTRRLQLALRSSRYGVWDRDLETGRQIWDERQHALYGLRPDEFDGQYETWLKFVHPEDRVVLQRIEQQLEAGGSAFAYEFRLLRRDGTIRHIEAHSVVERDGSGRAVRIVGMNRDITTEREHEAMMSAMSDRLQFVLNSSGYGVWEFDYSKAHLLWDDQLLKLYGVSRDSLQGGMQDFHDRVHPDDLEAVRSRWAAIPISRQNQFTQQFRIVRPDGAVRHVEARSYVLRHADGRPLRMIGFDNDVTEARELREQLRLAEERWKLALSSNNDGVWDWDIITGETYRDERYAEMLGTVVSELPAHRQLWRELGHPDDVPGIEAALNDHLAGRTPVYQCEYRMRHKDGRWVWILGRGMVVARDAQGQPTRMAGTQTDITPRKQLEEKLRHGEEMSLQLGRLAQIGAWEWEIANSKLTWSPEMFRIHEVPLGFEPTLPKSLEFYPPAALQTLNEALTNAVLAGTSFDLELPFKTALGQPLFVRVLARAEVKDGRTTRIYGAFQDITARRDAEEMRRQLEGQVFQTQKMETLGTLAGGIAHDFNNLLTGILGYQDLALDTLAEADPARAYLSASIEASLRARELVEQILAFSRQADSEKVPVDLGQVVEDARRFLRATVPATIRIDVEVLPHCGRVLADATQIYRVLLNLGSNAAHAMRATGGTMRLRVEPAQFDLEAASVHHLQPGQYVKIVFSDTGHGMDEQTAKRIFDPFFTTKEVGQGTGLGLSVVHGIIEAHRGTITVHSNAVDGTTFTLFLPVANLPAPVDEEATGDDFPHGAGELLAVVDDDDTVRRFVEMAVEKIGYRVVAFDSPVQCLETMRRNPADYALLLTDQTMPGMKGMDLAAEVRSFAPQLPLLIMSGYFSRISPDKLAQLGHVALLSKPFTNDELARAIHRALHPEPVPEGI